MKNKKMLINFLTILLTAILLGIVAGRYVSASGMYITLTPPLYMQGLVYASPFFMIPAVVGLVVYMGGRGKYPRLPLLLSVYVYTVIGVIVSGFCGLYTMKNFVPAVLGMISAAIVLLCIVMAGKQCRQRVVISADHRHHVLSKAGFVLYGAVVIISAFIPIGPMPVIIIGAVAAIVVLAK